MTPTQDEIEEFQNLERTADTLLSAIAASQQVASDDSIRTLDSIAARAAKIAYGTGNPGMVSKQMHALIAWTDHLDDAEWRKRFEHALRTRPLERP